MEHFYHLPHMGEDYFTYANLYRDMVAEFDDGSHFVELGGFKGKSTAFLAVEIINSGKEIQLDCIDSFVDCPQGSGESIKSSFLNNIKPVNDVVRLIISDSAKAADGYENESIDFIFLDADHTYDGVKTDILYWFCKVKPGGIMAGHDYQWEGVKRAVDTFLPNASAYNGCPDCWYIRRWK